ncbi:MAG: Mth938-like domain-containing protein [Actinomycetota bacterium]|nr:Mth938-like domain-containing protein [Actinomycetota bacterium]
MNSKLRSPEITHLSWGRLEAGGGTFKDAKLFPGGVREWDWGETGTRHTPGIQPADVEELLEHGATTVVFAKGFYGQLGVCRETLEMLEGRGVSVHAESSEGAVRLYNELREKEKIGALVHSTC